MSNETESVTGDADQAEEAEVLEAGAEPEQRVGGELLQRIVEGALLAAGKPLAVADLAALFEDHERPHADAIRAALQACAEQCAGRGFELREVASGFRFQVVQDVAPWIGRLWEEKPQKYSRALLETLALIAYRQPITRGDIEDIRGVAVASNIVKTLLERDWIRVVGHKDVPGRPAMYATTRKFLDYFNLKNLDDLPALAEVRDLDSLNAELALEGADTALPGDGGEEGEGGPAMSAEDAEALAGAEENRMAAGGEDPAEVAPDTDDTDALVAGEEDVMQSEAVETESAEAGSAETGLAETGSAGPAAGDDSAASESPSAGDDDNDAERRDAMSAAGDGQDH